MAGNPGDEFEALARRYWTAWGEALRGAAPGAGAMPGGPGMPGGGAMPGAAPFGTGSPPGFGGMPGMGGVDAAAFGADAWRQFLDGWSRLAQDGRGQADDAIAHFNRQVRDGYARMQEVAARFAGQDSSAADVATAWKEALGAAGTNPFPELLRTMRGHGLQGVEQWMEDASSWLDPVRGEALSWLRLPAFGPGREHQERMQALARHLAASQQASSAYNALLLKAQQEAFSLFESKLAARGESDQPVQGARALFDVWIDAAEEAYAEVALSPGFRRAYADLVNSQMRVRGAVQRMVEDACAQLGMPTRTELDGAHRRLAALEREVRGLRDAARRAQGGDAPRAGARSRGGASGASKHTTARKVVANDAAARNAATKQAAGEEAPRKKAPAKKATTKKATTKKVATKKVAGKKVAAKKVAARKQAPTRKAGTPGSVKKGGR